MRIFVLDKQENLLTTLDESIVQRAEPIEQLNNEHFFTMNILADHEDAIHVEKGNLVAFEDIEGDFQLFEINLVDDSHSDIAEREVNCHHASLEMLDDYVADYRPTNATALEALTKVLEGTRWQVGTVADLGIYSTNFYRENPISCINKILNTWGGEVRYRVVITANKITARYVDILSRRGADTGKRFEYGKDLLEVQRTEDLTQLKTALRGFGKGEETGDGFGRRIDFKDVVWSVANGDPVDKPLGQDWVGDEEAKQSFGRPNSDGTIRHRFGIFEDSDIEDPEELLWATYNQLQQAKIPITNYRMKVRDLERLLGYDHEKIRLGDTAAVLDYEIQPAIELKSRVIEIKRDLLEPENDEVEVGQFLPLFTDEDPALEKVIAKVNDRAGIWETVTQPIQDSDFPNTVPATPTNVIADGLFRNVLVSWDFDSSSYIAAYEVYASEIAGFTASSTNLVFRGKTSSFAFEGLTNKQYYFRVRAVNHHGTASDYSLEVTATTARVVTDDILFGAVTADLLADLAVTAGKLADGAVGTSKLVDDAITNAKIAANAVAQANIQNGAINNSKLADLAVDAAKLADSSVTATKIANLAVGSAAIQDLAVKNQHVERLNADKITIGGGTSFASGYDPTTKETPSGSQAKADAAESNASEVARAMSSGRMMNTDPTFLDGNNGVSVYNNSGGGTVTHARITRPSDCPTTSTHILEVRVSNETTSPNHGGFTFLTQTRANASFIVKFIAKLESGRQFNWHSNGYGTGSIAKWLSSNQGTGKYDEYIFKVHCGSSGTFSTTNFFSVSGGSKPFNWQLGYATVFDVTNNDLPSLWSWGNTTFIDGGNIYANSVTSNEMATGTITAASGILADAVVTSAKIANAAVGTIAIANAAITNAKIANLAVNTAQIADAAISRAKIANLAVDAAKIADAAITRAKIANLAVDSAKIANLDASKLIAGSVIANDVIIKGNLEGATGTFSGSLSATDGSDNKIALTGTSIDAFYGSFSTGRKLIGINDTVPAMFDGNLANPKIEAYGKLYTERVTISAPGKTYKPGDYVEKVINIKDFASVAIAGVTMIKFQSIAKEFYAYERQGGRTFSSGDLYSFVLRISPYYEFTTAGFNVEVDIMILGWR